MLCALRRFEQDPCAGPVTRGREDKGRRVPTRRGRQSSYLAIGAAGPTSVDSAERQRLRSSCPSRSARGRRRGYTS